MSLEETLTQLEGLGTEHMREQNTKHGAGDTGDSMLPAQAPACANRIP
jgi:hypothetical protein